jgi:hypothetical protein
MNAILTQFLIDIVRGARKAEFAADPEAVICGSALDSDLRQAVRSNDISALWLAGAHPMALMYFARSIGWSNERYYACLDDAELKRFARAASL